MKIGICENDAPVAQDLAKRAAAFFQDRVNDCRIDIFADAESFSAADVSYDLVFMDIQMPVMNGLIATETIRKLPEPDAAAVPIIAMTADAFSENVAACLAAGMDGHIAKPVDINIVLKEMRRIKESKQKGERNA